MSETTASSPAGGLARCVDCGTEIDDEAIFRVLRTDRAGRRHVVCRSCSERRHGEAVATPLQIQTTMPARLPIGTRRPHES